MTDKREPDAKLDAGLAQQIRDAAQSLKLAVVNAQNAGLTVALNLPSGYDAGKEGIDPAKIRVVRDY